MKQEHRTKLAYFFIAIGSILIFESFGRIIIDAVTALIEPHQVDFLSISQSSYAFSDTITSVIISIVYWIIWRSLLEPSLEPKVRLSSMHKIAFAIIIPLGIGGTAVLWNRLIDLLDTSAPILTTSVENLSVTLAPIYEASYLWTFLSIVVAGPILEELLFRGIIFTALERIYPKPWFPIIISGVIFGIWHGNIFQSVYTLILGMILGLVYYYTRDMVLAILIHAIYNFLTTLPSAWDTLAVNRFLDLSRIILIIPMLIAVYRLYKLGSVAEVDQSVAEDYL